MAVLENGYGGDERRRNTSKVRFEFKDYLKIVIIQFITLLFAIGIWYGVTNYRMNAFAENDIKLEAKNIQQDKDIISIKTDVAVIRAEQQILKIDVKDIKNETKKNNELLYEIKGLLSHNTSHLGGESFAGDSPIIRRIE